MNKVPLRPGARMPALISILATVLLLVAAGFVMFSAFMFYDDEGYVLISLRNFAEHGALYREVYSQYGPFPYVFYYALSLLGFPFTHTAGRLLTLLVWSGTAVACASIVWSATRNLALRLAVLASAFVFLWTMVSEPTHPGGLIALITAGMAWFGYRAIAENRVRAWAIVTGLGTSALILTKINMGGLAALSAIAWYLLHDPHQAKRSWVVMFLMVAIAALPFALMRFLLGSPWVQTYAIMFACAGVPAIGAVGLASAPRITWREAIGSLVAGIILAAIVAAVILARGSSPADLLEGVLLRPLRHPVHFNFNFAWPRGVRALAATSTGLFVLAWFLRRRFAAPLDLAVAVGRILAAAVLAITVARFPSISPDHLILSFAAPWLWLFLWPLTGEDRTSFAARSWVGLLFLGQCLHGFPVRGSQTAWGTFLALPIAGLGVWQALAWLQARYPSSLLTRRTTIIGANIFVGLFAIITGWRLAQVGERYHEGADLNLPGAERLRLPENAAATLQVLSLNAVAHGDMLFSLPGMYSFNLWTGLPTPTRMNVTHWFSLLDEAPQQAIIRSLEAHPRSCIILQREHLTFIAKNAFDPGGPLHDYIDSHFYAAFHIDDYEFWIRKDRQINPLMLGEFFLLAPSERPENAALRITAFLPKNQPVARIELQSPGISPDHPFSLSGAAAAVEITPTNFRGEPIAPTVVRSWPFTLDGPALVTVLFRREDQPRPMAGALILFKGTDGRDIAMARLRP
jgi:hypothetical protein